MFFVFMQLAQIDNGSDYSYNNLSAILERALYIMNVNIVFILKRLPSPS